MPTEEQDPFGEYAPASQTDAASPVSQKRDITQSCGRSKIEGVSYRCNLS